jgi:hypothetical protein
MVQGECALLPGLGGGKAPASPLGGRDRAAKSTAIIEKMLSDMVENHPFPCPWIRCLFRAEWWLTL